MSEQDKVEVLAPEQPAELVAVVKREGVAEQTGLALLGAFAPFRAQIGKALATSHTIGDASDPAQRNLARACRLELRRVRCAVEDARKTAKADALRYGKAVDGMANVLKFLCEPEEDRLAAIEEYEARRESARIAALAAERTAALQAVGADTDAYNLGIMGADTWATVIEAATKAKADREETARKIEAERIAAEQAAIAERKRIEAENAKLRGEAAAREAELAKAEKARREIESKAKAEREAAAARLAEIEATARREREARESAERKAAAERAEAERIAKAEVARIEAERRKADQAPDRDKLLAFAAAIRAMELPSVATVAASKIVSGVREMQGKMATWVETKAREL